MRNIIYNLKLSKIRFKHFGKNTRIEKFVCFKNKKNISIGSNCLISSYCRIECWCSYNKKNYNPTIIIGDGTLINRNCHITAINSINISSNCLLGSNILITDHNHGFLNNEEKEIPPYKRDLFSKGSVEIGEYTWIGDNCIILDGVKIGKNCVIGANTVVTKSIPDCSVVCGNPGKIIKELYN